MDAKARRTSRGRRDQAATRGATRHTRRDRRKEPAGRLKVEPPPRRVAGRRPLRAKRPSSLAPLRSRSQSTSPPCGALRGLPHLPVPARSRRPPDPGGAQTQGPQRPLSCPGGCVHQCWSSSSSSQQGPRPPTPPSRPRSCSLRPPRLGLPPSPSPCLSLRPSATHPGAHACGASPSPARPGVRGRDGAGLCPDPV